MTRRMSSLLLAAGVLVAGVTTAGALPSAKLPVSEAPLVLIQSFPSDGEPDNDRDVSVGPDSQSGPSGTSPIAGADPIRAVRRDFLTIKTASLRFDRRIESCDDFALGGLRDCLAAALDAYAQDLGKAETLLPPDESPVPDIIKRAARKVRSAASKGQAIAAVREAAAAVRKSIALLVADDPIVQSLTTRASATIVSSLERTDAKLEQAVGL